MNEFFEDSFEFVLEKEGGYTFDANDAGGETKFGISKRSYPNIDIKNLTVEAAKNIYLSDYWQATGCDNLKWPLDLVVFDTAVNMGVSRAKLFLKLSKGDISTFLTLRKRFYDKLIARRPTDKKFYNGWINRLSALGRKAGIYELL